MTALQTLLRTYWTRLLSLVMVGTVLNVVGWAALGLSLSTPALVDMVVASFFVAASSRHEFQRAGLLCTTANGALLVLAFHYGAFEWWVSYFVSAVMAVASSLVALSMLRDERPCTVPEGVWARLPDGREIPVELRRDRREGRRTHWTAYAIGRPFPLPSDQVELRAEKSPGRRVVLTPALVTDERGRHWLATREDDDLPVP